MAAFDSTSRLLDIDEKDGKKGSQQNPNLIRNMTYGILAFIVACIIIGLSVSLSLLLNKGPQNLASQSSVQVLTDNIAAIEEQLELSANHTEQFKQDFDRLQVHLRHSSSTALKNILIDQERNIQNMLTILNASMRDLAIDIPEGEDWYKNYGAQLSKVQRLSMQREELLRLLQTGEAELSTK
ncbi:hypothetical protein MED121_15834 [Marinomonas sp. MED121]|uniref:hypothetical protein n=1 Tax=Marinomonas sp. MED121 TaxID=314277 RepID=UPI0000691124|nr:hypothetical protein [Marinomonas sp. MED121]EAQ67412.1 hypothetical protein MED121_15834 [Marinomonas sp. MED121]